ncbi:hypothetical protein BDV59DRAFT_54393 [Aspergillus ambiguus]|uniref:uncharacterized protein n=1 Tax=Aspergillus ambiguus TaxID=176160 RepID=UPI003CCDCDD8
MGCKAAGSQTAQCISPIETIDDSIIRAASASKSEAVDRHRSVIFPLSSSMDLFSRLSRLITHDLPRPLSPVIEWGLLAGFPTCTLFMFMMLMTLVRSLLPLLSFFFFYLRLPFSICISTRLRFSTPRGTRVAFLQCRPSNCPELTDSEGQTQDGYTQPLHIPPLPEQLVQSSSAR